jgi:MazG family protein
MLFYQLLMKNSDESIVQALNRCLKRMAKLRHPTEGCPWDLAQTPMTLRMSAVEEACELVDAIEDHDADAVCEELGDVLFQVVFHAQMAREAGQFDLGDVARVLDQKLVRRHPHVFNADAKKLNDPEQVLAQWYKIKDEERETKPANPLHGAPWRVARKMGEQAKARGLEWKTPEDALDQVIRELEEVRTELRGGNSRLVREELGDVLFTLVQVLRLLDLPFYEVLKEANRKVFARLQRAFRYIDEGMTPEAAWDKAK